MQLAELGEVAKYHNESDYLWDSHYAATGGNDKGESLVLGHRPTYRWAQKQYGSKEWWKPHESEIPRKGEGQVLRGKRTKPDAGGNYAERNPAGYWHHKQTPEMKAKDDAVLAAYEAKRAKANARRREKKAGIV